MSAQSTDGATREGAAQAARLTDSAASARPGVSTGSASIAADPRYPVVFANLSSGWGGGEQWHFGSARALAARGWPVELWVRPHSMLEERARAEGLAVYPIRLSAASVFNPLRVNRALAGLRRLRPGAVILNGGRELKSIGVLARFAGVPRVILRRGIPQPGANWLSREALRRVPTRVIANSQATLDALCSDYDDGLAGLRPRVIYNGVDPSGFEAPGVRHASKRVVAVGRLEWEKGQDLLVRAFQAVQQHVPQARLRLVGDGSERIALEDLADQLGVRAGVEFTGESRRVAELLRECDVFVLPSRWEGFGFVMVEAMLMELPVVAFDAMSAQEIVVNGVTGLLTPPEDVQALAAAIAALLESPARARDLGKAGRLRALSLFTMDRATSDLEHVLLEP
jgi:glycosyltransferase involved in cell wall biosynthesis